MQKQLTCISLSEPRISYRSLLVKTCRMTSRLASARSKLLSTINDDPTIYHHRPSTCFRFPEAAMNSHSTRVWRYSIALLMAFYGIGLVAYFFHALRANPQYDTQVIRYSYELHEAIARGTLGDYLLQVRKYPLFYSLPFFLTGEAVRAVLGELPLIAAHAIGRAITLVYGLGTLAVLRRLSLQWYGHSGAAVLLLTSILFFEFSTAIRPHIPVAFWTLLSLYFAARHTDHAKQADLFLSFLAGTLAFCTLQNGLLAFLFPLWSILRTGWKTRQVLAVCAITASALFSALFLGYPFLFSALSNGDMPVGIDLGHNVGLSFNLSHGASISMMLMGSEPFVLLFALLGFYRFWRRYDVKPTLLVAVYAYIILYFLLFAFHPISNGRFFIAALPILALIGAKAFWDAPNVLRYVTIITAIGIMAKLSYLAMLPNTYQQVTAMLTQERGDVTTAIVPPYFFEFPTEKLALDDSVSTFIVIPDSANAHPRGAYEPCGSAQASTTSDESMFLWTDVSWSLRQLFTAKALGPNLTVFCHSAL